MIAKIKINLLFKDTGLDLWRKERIQAVLYKAVKQEDVEMAAKCLKMGAVDVNTRYEPVRDLLSKEIVDQKVLLTQNEAT